MEDFLLLFPGAYLFMKISEQIAFIMRMPATNSPISSSGETIFLNNYNQKPGMPTRGILSNDFTKGQFNGIPHSPLNLTPSYIYYERYPS